jgi:hypothetical protein
VQSGHVGQNGRVAELTVGQSGKVQARCKGVGARAHRYGVSLLGRERIDKLWSLWNVGAS